MSRFEIQIQYFARGREGVGSKDINIGTHQFLSEVRVQAKTIK